MDGAGAGIILRAGRLTVQRMFELRTVRNASYCILGLNCSFEDSAHDRKLHSLAQNLRSPRPPGCRIQRENDAQKKMVPLRVGACEKVDVKKSKYAGMSKCEVSKYG